MELDDMEIEDYGFSHKSEDEVKKHEKDMLQAKVSEVSDMQKRLDSVKRLIWPFLEHLKENSDKPYVYWPNRTQKILELQRKIDNLVGMK